MMRKYYFYIFSNHQRVILYQGVTVNVISKIAELSEADTAASAYDKYNNFYVVHYEVFDDIRLALDRNEIIKNLDRAEKDKIILETNPEWKSLNADFLK